MGTRRKQSAGDTVCSQQQWLLADTVHSPVLRVSIIINTNIPHEDKQKVGIVCFAFLKQRQYIMLAVYKQLYM